MWFEGTVSKIIQLFWDIVMLLNPCCLGSIPLKDRIEAGDPERGDTWEFINAPAPIKQAPRARYVWILGRRSNYINYRIGGLFQNEWMEKAVFTKIYKKSDKDFFVDGLGTTDCNPGE